MRLVTHSVETPRGTSAYIEWRPAHLAGLVDRFWHYVGPSLNARKRVFPNGRVELLVNFAEPYRQVVGRGSERIAGTCIYTTHAGAVVVEQPERQEVLGVRLHPAAARAILGVPLGGLGGRHLDARDLVGTTVVELAERCHAAITVEARFEIALRWIEARLARARGIAEAIAWATSRIDQTGGAVAIAELRDRTGLSKSRFVAGFRDQIGLAPKLYARIARFSRVLAILQESAPPLVEVALRAGYYDQPHMNADFREFAGLTPRDFLAARHPLGHRTTAAGPPP